MTRWIFAALGCQDAEFISGDLREEFVLVAGAKGEAQAWGWYAGQVLRSVAGLLARRTGEVLVTLAPAMVVLVGFWSLLFAQLCLECLPGFFECTAASLVLGAMLAGRWRGLGVLVTAGLVCWAAAMGAGALPYVIAAGVAIPAGAFSAQVYEEVA